jgi:hypothetical protein
MPPYSFAPKLAASGSPTISGNGDYSPSFSKLYVADFRSKEGLKPVIDPDPLMAS